MKAISLQWLSVNDVDDTSVIDLSALVGENIDLTSSINEGPELDGIASATFPIPPTEVIFTIDLRAADADGAK